MGAEGWGQCAQHQHCQGSRLQNDICPLLHPGECTGIYPRARPRAGPDRGGQSKPQGKRAAADGPRTASLSSVNRPKGRARSGCKSATERGAERGLQHAAQYGLEKCHVGHVQTANRVSVRAFVHLAFWSCGVYGLVKHWNLCGLIDDRHIAASKTVDRIERTSIHTTAMHRAFPFNRAHVSTGILTVMQALLIAVSKRAASNKFLLQMNVVTRLSAPRLSRQNCRILDLQQLLNGFHPECCLSACRYLCMIRL